MPGGGGAFSFCTPFMQTGGGPPGGTIPVPVQGMGPSLVDIGCPPKLCGPGGLGTGGNGPTGCVPMLSKGLAPIIGGGPTGGAPGCVWPGGAAPCCVVIEGIGPDTGGPAGKRNTLDRFTSSTTTGSLP